MVRMNNEPSEVELERRRKLREARKRAVEINGCVYSSLTDASRQLGMNLAVLHKRVHSDEERFKDWKLV